MSLNKLPRFGNVIGIETTQISANSANDTILTAPTDGCRIDGINICCDDTANSVVLDLKVEKDSVKYQLGVLVLTPGAGHLSTGAAKPKDALNQTDLPFLPVDANSNPIFELEAAAELILNAKNLGAGKYIQVVATYRKMEAD